MDHRLIEGLMEAIAPIVRDAIASGVSKATAPLLARIEQLETRAPEKGEKGEPGQSVTVDDLRPLIVAEVATLPPAEPGKSVTVDDVRPMLEQMVAALPKAENGKDADLADVRLIVAEEVAKIPPPANGKDGQPGRDGVDGKAVDPEVVKAMVDEHVTKAFESANSAQNKFIVAETGRVVADQVGKRFEELPQLPVSFVVNESGMLVANYADGESKTIGKVRGEDGARGASVMDGSINGDGVLVLRMSDGRIIQSGIARGEPGADGKDGEQGLRGRDAHEIAIAPGIDETKSYAEGTCARWRGGLVRAERQTDPFLDGNIIAAGWSVILEGIAEEAERLLEDDRTIERSTTYTSGKTFTRQIKSPLPIYRGVWREQQYERGDSVTFGGSQFIANRDTSAKPETEDCGWQLAVKRGRDGKEGKQGMAGPRGSAPPSERRTF